MLKTITETIEEGTAPQSSLGKYPHRRGEVRSHPLFFFPSFCLVHYCHRTGERGLRYCLEKSRHIRYRVSTEAEHAHPNNFRRHCGTDFQWNCDLTDCHPFSSGYPFDHDSAAAPAIVLEASQKPRIAFHVVGASFLQISIFLLPCPQMSAQWSASWLCSCGCASRGYRCWRSVWLHECKIL